MLACNNLCLRYKTRTLFDNVNIKFEDDNCYGVIGANGAGKSTFLKILNGDIEPTSGSIVKGKYDRISYLVQDHNLYNDYTVLDTVIMGDSELYDIMKKREAIYLKDPFTDEDGIEAGRLEDLFLKKNGWQVESDVSTLLNSLGLSNDYLNMKMGELKDAVKVKVLLARSLFGNPDILLLDEPTNGLDYKSREWLEEFIINYKNIVIVISHDRHFLNKVCTKILDIDYEKIKEFVGNYDFWYSSSILIQKQLRDSNVKKMEKIKELEEFIRRFSANASKSRQATSRKKSLEKIKLDDLKASSRRYPYIVFKGPKLGNDVIKSNKIELKVGDKVISFKLHVDNQDKILLLGNELYKTALLEYIYNGNCHIGSTVKISYFPKNHNLYFNKKINMIEWLSEYSKDTDETYLRSFLGKMLFSGEEALKSVDVLSGGEKVRLMLAKIMLEGSNVLLLDEPSNHLDMESIQSLNKALINFEGVVIMTTNDMEMMTTIFNHIIDIRDDLVIDVKNNYEDFVKKYENY